MAAIGALLRRFLHPREGEDRNTKIAQAIEARMDALRDLSDADLRAHAAGLRQTSSLDEVFAAAGAVAHRVLDQRLFHVQILGALALSRGEIAEMQTGEGKTLAAVPAIIWLALRGRGVHVLTANDYLAERDAKWMGPIYEWFGLRAAYVTQTMTAADRRSAYASDITYATANEVGFDYLRDSLAMRMDEMTQTRPFAFAVIDEADSILIDEARIPLVIAGGAADETNLALRVDSTVRGFMRRGVHYQADTNARNVHLTDAGIHVVERALLPQVGSLFDEEHLHLLTAVQDAIHAHALLHRDIDYVVRGNAVDLVDEFKGRVAVNRRWPAGLQTAIEAKERVALRKQGRVLGSITVQNLVAQYETVCGMTGTAATQAEEFWKVYRLPVSVIPTNKPVEREDLPEAQFATRTARDAAVVAEICRAHATGQPVLVGTASVADSERLSAAMTSAGVPHEVLNARNDAAEARIIAQAGAWGAVTISTNMAGRGTDILLGGNPPADRDRVVELGGLYVIGTSRHEARRIDHQLRGRAGRQGDPGKSRFFVSLEDDLLVRYGIAENTDINSVQRTIEGQNLEIRQMLWKYESVLEHHRQEVWTMRRQILTGETDWMQQRSLTIIDNLWVDYLASVAELRGGVHWVQWGGRDPLHTFLTGVEEIYNDFQQQLDEELEAAREAGAAAAPPDPQWDRGATWTYLTTDQPFGTLGERIVKGLRRMILPQAK